MGLARFAVLVAVISIAAGCGGGRTAAPTTTAAAPKPRKPLPANAIRIHWKKNALVPAPHAGQACIVTYKTGRFCAAYRLGDIPATMLKRRLHAKGYIVITVP